MSSLVDSLKWRYATKRFNPGKKVESQLVDQLKEVVQLSPSSYGLQPYRVMLIEDPETKKQLQSLAWGQAQIVEAPLLFVFASYRDFGPEKIDQYLAKVAEVRNVSVDQLAGYGDFMKQKLGEKSEQEMSNWTARQSYLALSNLLSACADLKLDACPMEGFEPAAFDEVLGLSKKGLQSVVLAAVGYRSDEDQTQHANKVRIPVEELFLN
jgi:nitroreductase